MTLAAGVLLWPLVDPAETESSVSLSSLTSDMRESVVSLIPVSSFPPISLDCMARTLRMLQVWALLNGFVFDLFGAILAALTLESARSTLSSLSPTCVLLTLIDLDDVSFLLGCASISHVTTVFYRCSSFSSVRCSLSELRLFSIRLVTTPPLISCWYSSAISLANSIF